MSDGFIPKRFDCTFAFGFLRISGLVNIRGRLLLL
jgi:hypothetical protein